MFRPSFFVFFLFFSDGDGEMGEFGKEQGSVDYDQKKERH